VAQTRTLLGLGIVQIGKLISADFNSTSDQAIPITYPGIGYRMFGFFVTNPSVSMTTAAGGFYSAAAKGGTALVAASQVYSALTSNSANTAGNMVIPTLAANVATTTLWTLSTMYFSLSTPQGSAATADIYVLASPFYAS